MSPTFEQIFAVMAAASLGDSTARVRMPKAPDTEDVATRFAIALNILLDDLAFRAAETQHEAKFRALLEAAPDAMIIFAQSGNITLVNAQTEKLFGYSRHEVLGQSIDMLIPDRAALDPECQRKNGSRFPAEITLAAVDDSFTASVRDISARKQAETALKQANHELESFSYSVAHDLRSPLRAMSGYSQLLLDDYKDAIAAEGQAWLRRIVGNASKMAGLIDALLALAKVTRTEPRWESVDLSAIFAAVAAQEPGVELVIAPGLVAECDAQLMRALLENLFSNARKFTGGCPHPRIEFGAAAGAYFVRDNGAGFDMAFADKLFQPFQRLHGVDEFPGTGIGLATVQRIVHRHGGRIWAEGRVGEGATFSFTLPGAPGR